MQDEKQVLLKGHVAQREQHPPRRVAPHLPVNEVVVPGRRVDDSEHNVNRYRPESELCPPLGQPVEGQPRPQVAPGQQQQQPDGGQGEDEVKL